MNSQVRCTSSWLASLMPSARQLVTLSSTSPTRGPSWNPVQHTLTKSSCKDWKVSYKWLRTKVGNATFVLFVPPVHAVVMIHWTRQIKELLTSQESMDTSTSSGPLEEIEFWRARCDDYSSLTQQLDQPGVKKVVGILQKAKSSYITPFHNLSRQIQVCYVHIHIHVYV